MGYMSASEKRGKMCPLPMLTGFNSATEECLVYMQALALSWVQKNATTTWISHRGQVVGECCSPVSACAVGRVRGLTELARLGQQAMRRVH